MWARHGSYVPTTSAERRERVFPKGPLHPLAPSLRLSADNVTFRSYLEAFERVLAENDMPRIRAFIDSNLDTVPSRIFLRMITALKLQKQYENKLDEMEAVKKLRAEYIIAQDQVFFPLNVEIEKAETR